MTLAVWEEARKELKVTSKRNKQLRYKMGAMSVVRILISKAQKSLRCL